MNSITINGTQYPCSVCWAAIEKLIEQKGSCSLNELQNPKMWKPQDITTLMFWSLYYGCQATEGAPVFPFTRDSFSTVIGMAEVTAFMQILAEQTDSHLKKNSDKDAKKKEETLDYFQIKGYAIGAMGMDEGEFMKMRLGVFFLKLHFFVKDRKDRFNTLSALLRLHAFQVINSNRRKPLSDPKLLWKIEGENELSNTYVVPKEEMTEEFLKKIDDLLR